MIKFLEKLLNWIYIERCYFCGSDSEGKRLCSKCRKEISLLPLNPSAVIEGSNIYCATVYEGKIKQLIHRVKYKHDKKLSKEQSSIMAEYWEKLNINDHFIVIPVPQHIKRMKQRKGNHMDSVAMDFSEYFGYIFINDFVVRIKDTKPQYKLKKSEREINLQNAFSVNTDRLIDNNSHILILDDIKTTGTTLREIIKTLKEHGYNNITAFTTSRT